MILKCEAGHTYENIPVTEGFHEIPKRCYICGAHIASVKLTGSSTITGAGGFAGMAPPSEWSLRRPVAPGWYWYKEPGRNLNKPVAAWVFNENGILYASFFAPHDTPTNVTVFTGDLKGEWAGPMELPQ